MICSPRGIDGCCWRSGLLWRQNCPQVAALELVSSFVLQNSVTGPEKKLEKAIDLAYTTLMHVQLCSNAHLIMWLAHCILCKQQLISCRLQLAYMYSVAVLIIPMQLARSYSCMTSPRHQHLWCYFLFCSAAWVGGINVTIALPFQVKRCMLACFINFLSRVCMIIKCTTSSWTAEIEPSSAGVDP